MQYILASNSPRRKELLSMLLPRFTQVDPGAKEQAYPGLNAKQKALQLSKDKCIAAKLYNNGKNVVIISCDTIVDLKDKALEKPKNKAHAFNMLRSLSGRQHKVHTGVTVSYQGQLYSFVQTTHVYFETIPSDVIAKYVLTKEPYDKAGGYAIQGFMGQYIKRIDGCYYNVVGLPVNSLRKLLCGLGIL